MQWSAAQDAELLALREQGLSFTKCADALRCTSGQVAGRVFRLKQFKKIERVWTPERDERLLGLRKDGRSNEDIAEELNATIPAVKARLSRLLHDPQLRTARRDSEGADILAAALVADGESYESAAEQSGLDVGEVYRAVRQSQQREREELYVRPKSDRERLRTAWGLLGSTRDARS